MLYLDQMFLTCKTDLQQLVKGKVDIVQISIRRPALRAVRRVDGSWSLDRLLPLPKLSDRPPVASIEDGSLEHLRSAGKPFGQLHAAPCESESRAPSRRRPGEPRRARRSPFPARTGTFLPACRCVCMGILMGDHPSACMDLDLQLDPSGKAFLDCTWQRR